MYDRYATFSETARNALAFAHRHNWGDCSYLMHEQYGMKILAGLRVGAETNGVVAIIRETIPATMKAVRDFGGY